MIQPGLYREFRECLIGLTGTIGGGSRQEFG